MWGFIQQIWDWVVSTLHSLSQKKIMLYLTLDTITKEWFFIEKFKWKKTYFTWKSKRMNCSWNFLPILSKWSGSSASSYETNFCSDDISQRWFFLRSEKNLTIICLRGMKTCIIIFTHRPDFSDRAWRNFFTNYHNSQSSLLLFLFICIELNLWFFLSHPPFICFLMRSLWELAYTIVRVYMNSKHLPFTHIHIRSVLFQSSSVSQVCIQMHREIII